MLGNCENPDLKLGFVAFGDPTGKTRIQFAVWSVMILWGKKP